MTLGEAIELMQGGGAVTHSGLSGRMVWLEPGEDNHGHGLLLVGHDKNVAGAMIWHPSQLDLLRTDYTAA